MFVVLALSPIYAQDELRPLYDSLFQTRNHLINGKGVREEIPQRNGHPYFGQSGWQSGIVFLEGMRIPCKAIRYNLLNDHLLIQHFSKSGSHVIQLTRDLAREFQLGNSQFFYLDENQVRDSGLKPGYFEAVYRSETELWIKWEKAFTEGSSGSGRFEQTRNFYIMNGDRYFRITGRRSLLDVFPEMEVDLKEFLRKQGISVRRVEADDLIAVLRYYENNKTNKR